MNLVEKFIVPKNSNKKYTAIMKDGRRISFGDRNYEHYKDGVPVSLGGGKWSKLDHKDANRRRLYRTRHRSI